MYEVLNDRLQSVFTKGEDFLEREDDKRSMEDILVDQNDVMK